MEPRTSFAEEVQTTSNEIEEELRQACVKARNTEEPLPLEMQVRLEAAAQPRAGTSGLPVEIEASLLIQEDSTWAERQRDSLLLDTDPEDIRLLVLELQDTWETDILGRLPRADRSARVLPKIVPDLDRIRAGYRQYREVGKRGGMYADKKAVVGAADEILNQYFYMPGGYPLTLRQLYYKLVTKNVIPNNSTAYDKLVDTIRDARYFGWISWDMVIDRTRTVYEGTVGTSEAAVLDELSDTFLLDKWVDQPTRVEVWVEKDAAIGTIWTVCHNLQVPLSSTRGYNSASGMKRAAERAVNRQASGQSRLILHIADLDPSGWDMTRDINERLDEMMLADELLYGVEVGDSNIDRIALTMPQVHTLLPRGEDGKPLSQVAKKTDKRFKAFYAEYHSEKSWELDALEPEDLSRLIREAVLAVRDEDTWEASVEREAEVRARFGLASRAWDDVLPAMKTRPAAVRRMILRDGGAGL